MPKTLNMAVIGYGLMGRTHANAYRKVNQFFDLEHRPTLKAICGRSGDKAKAFAAQWGFESVETDWRRLMDRKDIDAIDICSPNNTHCEIALAAASAGKWVLCEKPLALNGKEARMMVEAVEKARTPNFVWFQYRRVPAIALAKQIAEEGRLGKVFHYRATYMQDWAINPELPQGGAGLWRLDESVAGSGVIGDLLSHVVDAALWLNGPITSVTAMTETFVKERKHQETGKVQKVGIDDACGFLARFANGSIAVFEATRFARGHRNQNTFEINGENGSVGFNLEDPHRLDFFDRRDPPHLAGWRSIHVSGFEHPYMKQRWTPGATLGYEDNFVNALADFLKGVETDKPAQPDFRSAYQTQLVLDAVICSAREQTWVNVSCQ